MVALPAKPPVPPDKHCYGSNAAELEKLEAALSNHEAALQR
jgi:hypothetical protein